MKKTLLGFVAIILLATTFAFAGCGKNEDFYKDTANVASEFYQSQDYAFLFDDNIFLDYGSHINDEISNQNDDYVLLVTFYEASLKNFTYMFSNLQSNLAYEPQHKGDAVRKAYKNFEEDTKKMRVSLDDFLQKKSDFTLLVGSDTTTQSSLSHLNQFKAHYKKLLYNAQKFYQSFKSAYTKGVLSYPNLKSEEIEPGIQKLVPLIAVGNLTSINLEYMFDDEKLIEHKSSSLELLEKASDLKSSLINSSKPEEDISLENLQNFLQVEKIYNTEISQFKHSLKNFSFTDYYLADDTKAFLEKNSNGLYFEKINSFINTYTTIYTQSLKSNLLLI